MTTDATQPQRKRKVRNRAEILPIPFELQLFSTSVLFDSIGIARSTGSRYLSEGKLPQPDIRIGRRGKYRGATILRVMSEGIA
jgi:hypothetical protein